MLVNTRIDYVRRKDLEGSNNGLLIIDFKTIKNYRLINLYRVFNPTNGRTQQLNFTTQLNIIINAINENHSKQIIIVGDFNLDDSKRHSINYTNHAMFNTLLETFEPLGLQQLINFPTWERLINNELKSSILDHIYVKDCTLISNITPIKTEIGDHTMVSFMLIGPPIQTKNYTKTIMAKLFQKFIT